MIFFFFSLKREEETKNGFLFLYVWIKIHR
jgi:hypothetical protein